jgi:ribosomal protein S18 acetylase RimI-like enzyme
MPLPFTVRAMDREADAAAVAALETVFETWTIYDVEADRLKIEMTERKLDQPRVKRYPIEDVFEDWATWNVGWVAELDGKIVGFAGAEHEPWHGRVVLWHLYVEPAQRQLGIGRALLAQVEHYGREQGARRVWLETSNLNVPGIAAYERMGYKLCGVDVTYYEATDTSDEIAVYLSKPLVSPGR